MVVLDTSGGDIAYYALAVFLVLVGLGSFWALWKLGNVFGRLSSFISGTERDFLPVVVKAGGTVDRVNKQLDKADTITDSAVSMAESVDTAVRAVSFAIAKPVEKVSGAAAGVSHAVSSFRKNRDFTDRRWTTRKKPPRNRAHDLHEDLTAAGSSADTAASRLDGRRPRRASARPGRRLIGATIARCERPPSCARAFSRSSRSATTAASRPGR